MVVAGAAVLTVALLLPVGWWLRGGAGPADESSTSVTTGSTTSVTTTTAAPPSTTTTPGVTTTVGPFFQITTVPERVSTAGLEVQINQPQLSHLDRRTSQPRINDQLAYRWPAAVGEDWSAVPADDRAELADLYGDEAMASSRVRDSFTGYRVTIRADGTWWYFGVQGD